MNVACQCGGEKSHKLEALLDYYRGQPHALIQVLHQVQEIYGYLPREVLKKVSVALKVPLSQVYGVVSFYSFFNIYPKGENQIRICKGTACYVRGASQLLERIRNELHIKPGETTEDAQFSLEVVRCLGACGLGPVVTINETVYARVRPERLPSIISAYRQK